MSKPFALLCATVAAGILVVTTALYIANPNRSALRVPHFGEQTRASEIFLPVKPSLEQRIIRHHLFGGTAQDDVLMRDGTTKQIFYDSHMVLRHVLAYYKGVADNKPGPLMYEKTENASGHLASDRHLRQDGLLESDGQLLPDNTYRRHIYYPAATPGPVQDPRLLVVQTEQVFDYGWKPVIATDFRQDGTRQQVHTWTATDDLITTLAEDGKTIVASEGKRNGNYLSVQYFPDGQTVKVDVVNSWQGTTVQYYRQDGSHTLALRVTFDNSDNDQITLVDAAGKPEYNQVWSLDYSGQPYSAEQPRRLDHIEHLNADGKVDIKYDFDRKTQKITAVTFYTGAKLETYGARTVYTVGDDGFATKVETFKDNNTSGGVKPLTAADGKRFVLDNRIVTRPDFTVPTLKEGLKLYGEPPQEEFDFD